MITEESIVLGIYFLLILFPCLLLEEIVFLTERRGKRIKDSIKRLIRYEVIRDFLKI